MKNDTEKPSDFAARVMLHHTSIDHKLSFFACIVHQAIENVLFLVQLLGGCTMKKPCDQGAAYEIHPELQVGSWLSILFLRPFT